MPHPYSTFKTLSIALAFTAASGFQCALAVESDAKPNPWAFNLSLYTWLPGANGNFSAGPLSKSVDINFIDIVGKLSNFPMAFNGRLEAHYERFGFFLDGNYMDMDFKPRFDGGISKGLSSQLGIMDYGATYRLFGPTAAELGTSRDGKARSNVLEAYVGGRTIWLDNQIQYGYSASASGSRSFTAPLLGGRIMVNFSPDWFGMVDGNFGGFGTGNVSFTGGLLGMAGYRTSLFGLPTSIEAGYKALRVNAGKGNLEANATLNGPFIGLTGYW